MAPRALSLAWPVSLRPPGRTGPPGLRADPDGLDDSWPDPSLVLRMCRAQKRRSSSRKLRQLQLQRRSGLTVRRLRDPSLRRRQQGVVTAVKSVWLRLKQSLADERETCCNAIQSSEGRESKLVANTLTAF